MGLPGAGIYKLFRNDRDEVLAFFKQYHDSRTKIYNMCNDNFVDPSQI